MLRPVYMLFHYLFYSIVDGKLFIFSFIEPLYAQML